MCVFSKSRNELFSKFVDYRKAIELWNEGYEHLLVYFDRFCSDKYPDQDGITQEMIDNWCIQRETENKTSLICRTLPARKLIEYLNKRKLVELNIPEMPEMPPKEHIPHSFSDAELSRFFSNCDARVFLEKTTDKKFYALQIAVIFRLLYSSGIRTTEARLLRVIDVDLEHGVINIRKSKNGIEHYVALHNSVVMMLRTYNSLADHYFPSRELFFPNRADKPFSPDMLTYEFHRAWDPVNTAKAVPYDLRHNYAIQNINSWISLGFDFNDKFMYLSKSMGHTTLESTRYYYSLVPVLASIIQDKTEVGFNNIVPEVPRYEEE